MALRRWFDVKAVTSSYFLVYNIMFYRTTNGQQKMAMPVLLAREILCNAGSKKKKAGIPASKSWDRTSRHARLYFLLKTVPTTGAMTTAKVFSLSSASVMAMGKTTTS